jgi:hypothetical protein
VAEVILLATLSAKSLPIRSRRHPSGESVQSDLAYSTTHCAARCVYEAHCLRIAPGDQEVLPGIWRMHSLYPRHAGQLGVLLVRCPRTPRACRHSGFAWLRSESSGAGAWIFITFHSARSKRGLPSGRSQVDDVVSDARLRNQLQERGWRWGWIAQLMRFWAARSCRRTRFDPFSHARAGTPASIIPTLTGVQYGRRSADLWGSMPTTTRPWLASKHTYLGTVCRFTCLETSKIIKVRFLMRHQPSNLISG